jgi:tetratricopeptide (TPR) repeat protein
MSITAYEDIKNACAEAIKSMRATSSITKGNNNNNSASQSNAGLNILLDSAHEYYVKGEYKKADIFFERVLEIEPNHIETLNGRGILLYRLADYDKARNCFEKVLQVDPKNIVALNSIEILGKKKDDTRQQIE